MVWDNLPAYDGGSLVSYQVTERNATPDYVALEIQKDEQTVGDTQTISYTFTNVEPMSFTVTKKWNPTDSAPEAAEVSAGLYRTTDAAQDVYKRQGSTCAGAIRARRTRRCRPPPCSTSSSSG